MYLSYILMGRGARGGRGERGERGERGRERGREREERGGKAKEDSGVYFVFALASPSPWRQGSRCTGWG